MSLYRIISRIPKGPLAHRLNSFFILNNRINQTNNPLLNIVPSNQFHSLLYLPNKLVTGQMSPLHRFSSVLQQFGLSSVSETDEKEKTSSEKGGGNTGTKEASTETGADAKVEVKKDENSSDSSESSEEKKEELTMEDLIKVVTEKEELLKVKHKEIENMQEKVLRTYAEMENVMDRTRREAENSKKFAIQNFAKGLLDVADNLSRAASVVKESFSKIDTSKDNAGGAAPLLKTLLEGVEMTEKQLSEVFKKFGVEKYDPKGEQFDPNRHNALFQVPDASKPPGTVQVVLKPGYVLHDRVIRPAEVGVTEAVENNETEEASKE